MWHFRVTTGVCEACPLEEYVNGDSDLPVCLDNSWENTFFAHFGQEEVEEEEVRIRR